MKEQESQKIEAPRQGVVLPAKKYRWKIVLLFSEVGAAIIFGYYCMIRNILADAKTGEFFWGSLRMISSYIVVGITLAAIVLVFTFKKTRSIRTRIERDNELRQDANISVWVTVFDWTWVFLFVPTIVAVILCGVVGYIVNWIIPESPADLIIHRVLGGFALGFGFLNAVVVIFKLTPTRVGLILAIIFGFCVVFLLMGVDVFLTVFEKFRHLGIKVDPLGYLLIAYLGFFTLRLIWIAGLFDYMAISPNRLDIQTGLSETGRGTERRRFEIRIDTEDVILRLFKIGRIIISFPNSDRLPISYLVTRIDKKSKYAVEAASVLSVGRKD